MDEFFMKRMGRVHAMRYICSMGIFVFTVSIRNSWIGSIFQTDHRPKGRRWRETKQNPTRLDSNHTRGGQRSRAEMEWTKTSFRVVKSVELFSFSKSKLETLSLRAFEDIFFILRGLKRPRLGHFAHSSPSLEDFSLACNDEPRLKKII